MIHMFARGREATSARVCVRMGASVWSHTCARTYKRNTRGSERLRGYLATGASAKYASRASTLFARQLYFLFANKCVPLKIIFSVRVMWDPRDGREEGIFWQRCTSQCFCSLRATWTHAGLCIPDEEEMIKKLTDYLRFLLSSTEWKIQRESTGLIKFYILTQFR